jgi:hypothetical protein
METAGKNITRNREKEGVKEMQKAEGFCVDESGWIHCPFCKCRTRTKIRADTSLKNFPVKCMASCCGKREVPCKGCFIIRDEV